MKKLIQVFTTAFLLLSFSGATFLQAQSDAEKIQKELADIEGFFRTIELAEIDLSINEEALSSVTNDMMRAREIAIQGGYGDITAEERAELADEVQLLQQKVFSLANLLVYDEYFFAGIKSDEAPFVMDRNQPNARPVVTYRGDLEVRKLQIAHNFAFPTRFSGAEIFTNDEKYATNLFQAMADFEVALRSNDIPSVKKFIRALDIFFDETNFLRMKNGSLWNVTNSLASQFEYQKEFLKGLSTAK